jgi:imidazolonepropionase-like amidohydrolase
MNMRTLSAVLVLLAFAGCAAHAPRDPAAAAVTDPSIAFVNVNVLSMESDRVLSDQTVIVRGDRIVSVGPSRTTAVPAGAQRIEGGGRYLIPGMAEMHGHIPPPTAPRQQIDDVLFLYVANGITTVRGMLGHPGQLELREQALRNEIIAPTLYLAGPSFHGGSINSPAEAVQKVREQKAEGWDLLKVHPGLELDEFEAMARTAAEEGIRFGGHVPAAVGVRRALELGMDSIDHVDGYVEALDGAQGPVDRQALAELVRLTRERGAAIVPTMALWEVLYGTVPLETISAFEELRYMPPQQVAQWRQAFTQRLAHPQYDATAARNVIDNRITVLRALHEGGATILFGTDAPQQFSVPGFSLHRELPYMSAAGMSNHAILASATSGVGRYFTDQDRFGLIAPGHRADLVLLDGNPVQNLDSLRNPAGVMYRGQWLPRDAINQRLTEIAARNAP